jgi:hypothetical protein
MFKPRRFRCERRAARIGKGVYNVLVENLTDKGHLGDPVVGGNILLRWIFRRWDVGTCTGSSWLRIGTGGGALENAVMKLPVSYPIKSALREVK